MCLITFAYHVHPDYPLILVANRDEVRHRPTKSLHRWEDADIIGGRDLEKGGTWLGVTSTGRFAAVTNVRNPMEKEKERSRGDIVTGFLQTDQPDEFLARMNEERERYGGYNLLCGDEKELFYVTNQDRIEKHPLAPGVYGLSNATLDTPWPKVVKAKERLSSLISNHAPFRADDFFAFMSDREKAKKEELPDTGVGEELEKELSSLFIHMEYYGTRSQTFLLLEKNGTVTIEERTFEKNNALGPRTKMTWNTRAVPAE